MRQLELFDTSSSHGVCGRQPAIGAGPLATEELLLEGLAGRVGAFSSAKRIQPVWVVVPSRALRVHLSLRIVERLGSSLVGVGVRTLSAVTSAIVQRCAGEGMAPVPSDPLFEVLVRRYAREEPALWSELCKLHDAEGYVVSSVRDLLSADLCTTQGQALEDLAAGTPGRHVARACALIRIARRVLQTMEVMGRGREGDLLALAATLVRERGLAALGAGAVLIHGYADATGQGSQLLKALLDAGAQLFVDFPRDPANHQQPDGGVRFCRAFIGGLGASVQRIKPVPHHSTLEGSTPALTTAGCVAPPRNTSSMTQVSAFEATGHEAEVREVAFRIAALLHEGVVPERIGVVARDLSLYALPLRQLFVARGIPFSGSTAPAVLFPEYRRWQAALNLLRMGGGAAIDCWLQARGGQRPDGVDSCLLRERLRLAFRSLGVGRLDEVGQLNLEALLADSSEIPLPLRELLTVDPLDEHSGEGEQAAEDGAPDGNRVDEGVSPDDTGTDDEDLVETAERQEQLAAAYLREAIAKVRRLCTYLRQWRGKGSVQAHIDEVKGVLERGLEWSAGTDRGVPIAWASSLERLTSAFPADFEIERQEFVGLVADSPPQMPGLGGAGRGVQVHDVTSARSLTFEHLFVIGLNRGVFPRNVVQDPLLPDDVRLRMRKALPHLGLKGQGHDEERYLFAQLVAAAPNVTLSWQWADSDGRARSRSPLVQRMCVADAIGPIERVPYRSAMWLQPPWAGIPSRPRTSEEILKLVALTEDRSAYRRALEIHAADCRTALSSESLAGCPADEQLAEARLAALVVRDQPPGGRDLAAHWGLVGKLAEDAQRTLPITTLEGYAGCPWQTLVRKVLRVRPTPDPLARLPDLHPLLVGNTVHLALQDLLTHPVSSDNTRRGLVVRPHADRVTAATLEAARRVASADGLHLPGLHRALAQIAQPLVERAIDLDWPHGQAAVEVVGAEVRRSVTFQDAEGRQRRVSFRADRVDRRGQGEVLTDYKTGRPLSRAQQYNTRLRHLRAAVARGERLQIAAYAMGVGGMTSATGRYLFLRSDIAPELSVVQIDADDPVVRDALPRVFQLLAAGWDLGLFFPRLEDAKGREPLRCRACEVAEACVRGDSGQRAQLIRSISAGANEIGSRSTETRLREQLQRLWWLGEGEQLDQS